MDGGLEDNKITRVVGLSSSVLFDKADPQNPINRRISIVMTRAAEAAALAGAGPQGCRRRPPTRTCRPRRGALNRSDPFPWKGI